MSVAAQVITALIVLLGICLAIYRREISRHKTEDEAHALNLLSVDQLLDLRHACSKRKSLKIIDNELKRRCHAKQD